MPETKPTLEEWISEPSLQALTSARQQFGISHGKFVRLDDLILVAPSTKFAPFDDYPRHLDILWGAADQEGTELSERVIAAGARAEAHGAVELERADVSDAGKYRCTFVDGKLVGVLVNAWSRDLGQVSESARQRTAEVMRGYFDSQAGVTVEHSMDL